LSPVIFMVGYQPSKMAVFGHALFWSQLVGLMGGTKGTAAFGITLDLAPDLKVAGMAIDMVPTPPANGDTGLNEAQIVSKLEKYMGDRVAAGRVSSLTRLFGASLNGPGFLHDDEGVSSTWCKNGNGRSLINL